MMYYSAAQAISPAIERTKRYLFLPFRWGRFLKLTLVALLTEGGVSSCNFNSNMPSGKGGGGAGPALHFPHLAWPALPILIGIALAAIVIGLLISLVISYLLVRLRFSFFDCVLKMSDKIAPAWRIYHQQALRYLGLSYGIGLCFWLIIAAAAYAVFQHFRPLFMALGSDTPPHFMDFLPAIAIMVPVAICLAIAASLANSFLGYFVLPRLALEDAPMGEAVADVWSDITAEPGQFLLFLLLKFLVGLAASILAAIVLVIPLVILAILGALAFALLKAVSTTLMVLLGVPAAIIVGVGFLLMFFGVTGMIGTFRRNYALVFYAGRYPLLGEILYPPPAPIVPPAPPVWIPPVTEGPI